MKESDVGLGRLKGERVDARPIFADPVDPASIEFDNALVAAADVEDEGESTVLLLKAQHLVGVYALAGPGWADDELYPHTVDIGILKIWGSCAGLEDVQILGVEVIGMRVAEMWSEDAGETSMVVFAQPQRIDIELPVARKHRVERREIAVGLLDDRGACVHKQTVDGGRRGA